MLGNYFYPYFPAGKAAALRRRRRHLYPAAPPPRNSRSLPAKSCAPICCLSAGTSKRHRPSPFSSSDGAAGRPAGQGRALRDGERRPRIGCNRPRRPQANDGDGVWRFSVGVSLRSSHWCFSMAERQVSVLLNMLLKETFFPLTNPLFQSVVFVFCFLLHGRTKSRQVIQV